ncbi:MAG: T9SS type A sorting domain-containing protein [Bacteroidales bacterium]|jgi:hypothetical protein|nr:T9SS type A sorting domain-containing protein [Bacteroidales bacterium]
MRNFVLFFLMVAFGISAKAQNEEVITWLPDNATIDNSYGNTSSSTITVYMEFNSEDIMNYKSTKKKLDTIKQVQFNIRSEYFSSITACKVILMQGDEIQEATEVVNQVVNVSNLVSDWNITDLATAYTIDPVKKLYIGYQLSFTGTAYPFSVKKDDAHTKSWIRAGTGDFQNLSGYIVFVKAVAAVGTSPTNEINLVSLNIEKYNKMGDSLAIRGTVKNIGTDPITSFSISYELNGISNQATISGVNIASGASYNFTYPSKYYINTVFLGQIKVRVYEPNGVTDMEFNNAQETEVRVYSSTVQRVVLHEVFTSSTCNPCNPGNVQLKSVLNQVNDITKWACIKYQYYFPSTGDPYFTDEGYTRGTFYGGIDGVPTLVGDGGTYKNNPGGYSISNFNNMIEVPAIATMTASVTLSGKTVTLEQMTITPVTNLTNSNLRFFAAIVEKKTVNNAKTNGETEFLYVMKKFLTSINGDAINALEDGKPIVLNNYTYTFNGNYRLPVFYSTRDAINHNTEHSVEDFNNLMVVYWLQDIVTKEVYQAGKTDPNPGYTPPSYYTVTTNASPSDAGVVAGGPYYVPNTEAHLVAYVYSNSGYNFVRWSDGVTDNPRTVKITQDTSFTAIFEGTNIIDVTQTSSTLIFPNPVQDVLYITTDANIEQIEIYNIQGQLIKTENTNAGEISTMDLSQGLYLLRITSDKGVSTHKFIKQ